MKKKTLLWKGLVMSCAFAVAASAGLASSAPVHAEASAQDGVKVQINDQLVPFPDAQPFIDGNEHLQVPVRFLSEQLGYQLDWKMDGSQVDVSLSKNGQTIHLTTGERSVNLDGIPFDMDTNAVFSQGRVFVPLRFLSQTAGVPLQWDNHAVTAILNTDGKQHAPKASAAVPPYKKVLDCVSTAYSAAPEENGGYAGLDYFGNLLKVGTVAVDPSVIPLGSTLYIEGYDFNGLPVGGMKAVAADIGGAIRGNRIDIFIPGSPQKLQQYGFQNVKVYVLK